MYEQLKNDLLVELVKGNFDNEDIHKIMMCMDKSTQNYEITKSESNAETFVGGVPSIVESFLLAKKVEGFAEGTLYNYERHLNNFFNTMQKMPDQVTSNDIRVYLYDYQQERNISSRSLDKVRSSISSFYNWIFKENYIDKNPMISVGKIKYEKKTREACTQTDLEYLRIACKTPKQRAILEVLYSTGCRVGELVILKKDDIDWDDKSVHLFGKGKKHRTSFLNAKAEVALKEYLNSRKDDKEWLFVSDRAPHEQMHRCGVQKIMREMSERASKDTGKRVTCHVLRHTFSTVLVDNNANIVSVQKLLGHQNIATTMNYVHTSLSAAKMEHRKAII